MIFPPTSARDLLRERKHLLKMLDELSELAATATLMFPENRTLIEAIALNRKRTQQLLDDVHAAAERLDRDEAGE